MLRDGGCEAVMTFLANALAERIGRVDAPDAQVAEEELQLLQGVLQVRILWGPSTSA